MSCKPSGVLLQRCLSQLLQQLCNLLQALQHWVPDLQVERSPFPRHLHLQERLFHEGYGRLRDLQPRLLPVQQRIHLLHLLAGCSHPQRREVQLSIRPIHVPGRVSLFGLQRVLSDLRRSACHGLHQMPDRNKPGWPAAGCVHCKTACHPRHCRLRRRDELHGCDWQPACRWFRVGVAFLQYR